MEERLQGHTPLSVEPKGLGASSPRCVAASRLCRYSSRALSKVHREISFGSLFYLPLPGPSAGFASPLGSLSCSSGASKPSPTDRHPAVIHAASFVHTVSIASARPNSRGFRFTYLDQHLTCLLIRIACRRSTGSRTVEMRSGHYGELTPLPFARGIVFSTFFIATALRLVCRPVPWLAANRIDAAGPKKKPTS